VLLAYALVVALVAFTLSGALDALRTGNRAFLTVVAVAAILPVEVASYGALDYLPDEVQLIQIVAFVAVSMALMLMALGASDLVEASFIVMLVAVGALSVTVMVAFLLLEGLGVRALLGAAGLAIAAVVLRGALTRSPTWMTSQPGRLVPFSEVLRLARRGLPFALVVAVVVTLAAVAVWTPTLDRLVALFVTSANAMLLLRIFAGEALERPPWLWRSLAAAGLAIGAVVVLLLGTQVIAVVPALVGLGAAVALIGLAGRQGTSAGPA